jgi:hypothetical protein
LEQLKTISKEDYAKVKAVANIVKPLRSVIHKTPDDYGMTGWRNIHFELIKIGAFTAAEMTPQHFASRVKMPVLMIQVLKDSWTRNPEDAQKTFDLLGSKDKELDREHHETFQGRLQLLRKASGENHRLLRQAYEAISRKGRTNRGRSFRESVML